MESVGDMAVASRLGALQLLEEVLVEGKEIAAHICEIRFKGLLMGQGRC